MQGLRFKNAAAGPRAENEGLVLVGMDGLVSGSGGRQEEKDGRPKRKIGGFRRAIGRSVIGDIAEI